MGQIKVDSEKGVIPTNTPVQVITRISIFPSEADQGKEPSKFIITKTYVLLDNSGSMEGDKIRNAKAALIKYYKMMKEGDLITIATFSSNINYIAQNQKPFQNSVENIINEIGVEGGTNMYLALSTIYGDCQAQINDRSSALRLLILTDGNSSDGTIQDFIEISVQFQRLGVPMYIIGIGDDYDEDLLIKMFRANEIGFFYHISNPTDLNNLFNDIAQEKVLYPSRTLTIKLTLKSSISKIYKLQPQVMELDPKKIDENTYSVPLGNLGTEVQKILIKMVVPARVEGEFREAVFSTDMNGMVNGYLILKRSNDINAIKSSINEDVKAEYLEAESKVLAVKALDKSDQKEAIQATQQLKAVIQTMKNSPSITHKLGENKIKELDQVTQIASGTVKASNEDIKKTKSKFTQHR